jgi:hypothetical protein
MYVLSLLALPATAQDSKFDVKIRDEKTVVVDMEDSGGIDPTKRINFNGGMGFNNFNLNTMTMQGQQLHLSYYPQFLIDGRMMQAGQGGRLEAVQPLGKGKGGKKRDGYSTAWIIDGIHITQTVELHPSKQKKPGEKRLMNTVLVTYTLENKGTKASTIAVRTWMDTYIIDNDGCLYASPVTHPKQILDGMVLKDKQMPPYLQLLQRPDLNAPGYVAHLTFNIGGKYEKAEKLILSSYRVGATQWEMPVQNAMGDSALSFYWASKELKPGAKRELGYAYGEGIATSAEAEGRFQLDLGGSFVPGKMCTISALVADPGAGQSLKLELPPGMERLEGKEIEAVSPLADGQDYSTVLWKARVTKPGEYSIRVTSSTGITQTKIVTITAEK